LKYFDIVAENNYKEFIFTRGDISDITKQKCKAKLTLQESKLTGT